MVQTSLGAEASPPDRVLLVDPSVLGQSHLLVNLGIIELALNLFSHVDVVAESDHCKALAAYGANSSGRVAFRPYGSREELTPEVLGGLAPDVPVIFLNLEYVFFARIMMSRAVRRRQVYWVLHSHFASPPTTLRARGKFVLRRTLLFTLFPRSRFIVYGERIRHNLLAALGSSVDPRRVMAVVHPLGIAPLTSTDDHDGPVRITFVRGWHAPPPSTEAAVAALAALVEGRETLEFGVVSNSVGVRSDGSKVISSDYRERLDRLDGTDLVLYLPTNDYTLQASGALMDSFVSGRPLLGLRTDFQLEIEALVGPVGFFFETEDELLAFVPKLGTPEQRAAIEARRANLAEGYRTMQEAGERQLRAVLELGGEMQKEQIY